MEKSNPLKALKSHAGAIIYLVAILGLGFILVALPAVTAQVLLRFAGVALLLVGGCKILQYFLDQTHTAIQSWHLASGAMLVMMGLLVLIFPDLLVELFPTLVGVVLLGGGVIKFQISFDLKRIRMKHWYVFLILALISIVLGWVTIMLPYDTQDYLLRLSGAFLIYEAIVDTVSFITFHRFKSKYNAHKIQVNVNQT